MNKTTVETYEVTLEPIGKQIEVNEGQTILDALIRNGIQTPYGCRHGSCSACKARVLEGNYEIMGRVSEYSLLSFERDEGMVLLCSTLAESDLVIEIEEEEEEGVTFFPVIDFEATVIKNEQVTPDIHVIELHLESSNTISYAAGQYFEFQVQEEETRAYSAATRFEEGNHLQFHVKRIPNGLGSNYMCDLDVGETVTGSGPYGKMQLRDRDRDLIFVAGGSGMAPIKALIEEVFSESFEHEAWFFYGARTEQDLYLVGEWLELEEKYPNFHFIPALSNLSDRSSWSGEKGFIADVIKSNMESCQGMDAYLCGPPIMCETVTDVLHDKGLRGNHIYLDEF
ncbi:NADH:ubiquinone reductase (Na(+)-transporting) subunit F [Schinkia sp. CFF1]